MKLRTFAQAEQFLTLYIPKNSQQKFSGELGLKRTKYFLHLLGDPQNKLKVVHIAGTSGKGSTCYLISSLLYAHGFKVGFHQSPHLTDVRERFQINNKIISKKEFIFYLKKIIPIINTVGQTSYGSLTYFEILIGLAFVIFFEKKVDYAVIETGMGGWYDGTNVVDRRDKVTVLTKIGYDHMEILGKTLPEIAFQKAMIINNNSQVISIYQQPSAKKIIQQVAEKKQAKVFFVGKNNRFSFKLNLIGDYQRENAGLALAAVNFLGQRDEFIILQENVKKVFEKAHFPGRFDIRKIKGKTVVFDGAHNPQKMEAFTNALKEKYPKRKFHFLIAFKKGKDYQSMLRHLVPLASKITITSFFVDSQELIQLSENPEAIRESLEKMRFRNYRIINQPEKAFKLALEMKKEIVVITGSLYLLGEIYRLIKKQKNVKISK